MEPTACKQWLTTFIAREPQNGEECVEYLANLVKAHLCVEVLKRPDADVSNAFHTFLVRREMNARRQLWKACVGRAREHWASYPARAYINSFEQSMVGMSQMPGNTSRVSLRALTTGLFGAEAYQVIQPVRLTSTTIGLEPRPPTWPATVEHSAQLQQEIAVHEHHINAELFMTLRDMGADLGTGNVLEIAGELISVVNVRPVMWRTMFESTEREDPRQLLNEDLAAIPEERLFCEALGQSLCLIGATG